MRPFIAVTFPPHVCPNTEKRRYMVYRNTTARPPSYICNPFKPSVLFMVYTSTNSAESDQTPQNVASDQVLHYLLKVLLYF